MSEALFTNMHMQPGPRARVIKWLRRDMLVKASINCALQLMFPPRQGLNALHPFRDDLSVIPLPPSSLEDFESRLAEAEAWINGFDETTLRQAEVSEAKAYCDRFGMWAEVLVMAYEDGEGIVAAARNTPNINIVAERLHYVIEHAIWEWIK